jgi:undecaprenyl-diphosphatase
VPAPPIDLDVISWLNHPGIPTLDGAMRALSSSPCLLALSCALGVYIYMRSPRRLVGVAVLIVAIGLSDATSARVLKPWIARVRPCNLHPPASLTLETCQRGLSFPSNHAANVAAAAVVAGWAAPLIAPWAAALAFLVGVSRVYLGQHWPTDVLAGWALGSLIAFLVIQLVRLRYSMGRLPPPPGRAQR